MAVLLGDGMYHFTKIFVLSLQSMKATVRKKKDAEQLPVSFPPAQPAARQTQLQQQQGSSDEEQTVAESESAMLTGLRNRVFMSDPVPW